MGRAACLIVNPSAGGGRALACLPAVEDALRRGGVSFHTAMTTGPGHAVRLAEVARDAGETAVAFGGDGLVGCIAGALQGSDGVLGVLPGGRGNDFARMLGIPNDPVAACAVIANGAERQLDLGDVEGRPFVGIASCGVDADANRIANQARLIKGRLVYLYAAVRAIAVWRPARFDLEMDGQRHGFTGYTVAAANSKAYGGGMLLAPDADLTDGLLDVVCIAHTSKLRCLVNLAKVFRGTHVHEEAVRMFRAREVTISADRPLAVYADGDPIGALPVTIRARPAALRVLVAT